VVRRGELTDAQWELIQPLLPLHPPHTGRPALDHRLIVNAILWLTLFGDD
jgi:transposase